MSSQIRITKNNIKLKNISYITPSSKPSKFQKSNLLSPPNHINIPFQEKFSQTNIFFSEKRKNNPTTNNINQNSYSKRSSSNKISNLLRSSENFFSLLYKRNSSNVNKRSETRLNSGRNFIDKVHFPSSRTRNNKSTDHIIKQSSSMTSMSKIVNNSLNNIKVLYTENNIQNLKKQKKDKEGKKIFDIVRNRNEGDEGEKSFGISGIFTKRKNMSTNGTNGTKESKESTSNTNTVSLRKTNGSKISERNYNSIDTPEELHFFYVGVIQNGKELGYKF